LIVGDGSSIHVRRLVHGLVAAGLQIELACFEGGDGLAVPIHRLGGTSAANDFRYVLGIPRLAAVIRRRRPKVVNAHYLSSFGLMAAAAISLNALGRDGPRLMQTTWGDDLLVAPRRSWVARRMASWALRRAWLVTGDSADLQEAAHGLCPSAPWVTIVFGPPAQLLEQDLQKQTAVVSARMLIAEMRIDLIAKAFVAAGRMNEGALAGWRLIVASDGPERLAVEQILDGAGVDASMAGHLDHEGLLQLLKDARIYVSIPVSDGTSATLLESLACGVVPVVNDLPANREWVDESIGVVVSRDPSIEELAEGIIRAAQMSPHVERLRDRVRDVTWESQVERFASLIREAA
jgi:glycosyltransferase involved in cell wall biosynthesis